MPTTSTVACTRRHSSVRYAATSAMADTLPRGATSVQGAAPLATRGPERTAATLSPGTPRRAQPLVRLGRPLRPGGAGRVVRDRGRARPDARNGPRREDGGSDGRAQDAGRRDA